VEVKEAIGMVAQAQEGQGAVGTEVAVGHQDVAGAESGPQVVEQLIFTDGVRGGGLLQENSGFEAENADQTDQRKTETGLLVLRLWVALAIGGCVGEANAGSIDNLERALARDA
jgi:hypothetical protein